MGNNGQQQVWLYTLYSWWMPNKISDNMKLFSWCLRYADYSLDYSEDSGRAYTRIGKPSEVDMMNGVSTSACRSAKAFTIGQNWFLFLVFDFRFIWWCTTLRYILSMSLVIHQEHVTCYTLMPYRIKRRFTNKLSKFYYIVGIFIIIIIAIMAIVTYYEMNSICCISYCKWMLLLWYVKRYGTEWFWEWYAPKGILFNPFGLQVIFNCTWLAAAQMRRKTMNEVRLQTSMRSKLRVFWWYFKRFDREQYMLWGKITFT